jgi:hypothetical protein
MAIHEPPCGSPGATYHWGVPSRLFKKAKNKYAGNCCICGKYVAEGNGGVEKDSKTGKWDVMC